MTRKEAELLILLLSSNPDLSFQKLMEIAADAGLIIMFSPIRLTVELRPHPQCYGQTTIKHQHIWEQGNHERPGIVATLERLILSVLKESLKNGLI